jgi:hypothetical protein
MAVIKNISFSPPDITDAEIEEVIQALKSGWITTGPRTKLFEQKIAEYLGVNKAVCLNSATAAMELTLRILGIGPGDEVITSAYTYTASASVIDHVGAKIVLVDVAPDSFEMDYSKLADAITERTKAIIPVDIAGKMCDYEKIYEAVQIKKELFKANNEIQGLFNRVKQWLQEDLQAATKEWKFVVFHVPAYPATYDYKEIDKSIRANWIPVLEQNRVDMVFVGHQHQYMRTHPLYQGEVQTDPAAYGIVYVMGNAGSKTYPGGGEFSYIAVERTGSNYQIIQLDGDVLTLTAKEASGELIETYTINKGSTAPQNPAYTLSPLPDSAYTTGTTKDGIKTMTVNAGVAGFKYFTVGVTPVAPHNGIETVVFTHQRNGSQLGLNAARADFDQVDSAQAGFNVREGDVIKACIVDCLTSAAGVNPVILQ